MKTRFPALLLLATVAILVGCRATATAAPVGIQPGRVAAASPATTTQRTAATIPGGALTAPTAACPGQEDLEASPLDQQRTMGCMVNFARRAAGLPELTKTASLERSAADKLADILGCDDFSHAACGRGFTYWMRETGYFSVPCWHVGENLAWGVGDYSSVRSIFVAWMHSPDHRANILGNYAETGLALRVGSLGGRSAVHVWAEHFGSRCD